MLHCYKLFDLYVDEISESISVIFMSLIIFIYIFKDNVSKHKVNYLWIEFSL